MLLQTLLCPIDNFCKEHDLYFRIDGVGGYSQADRSIAFQDGSWLRFDTFFNILSIAKWDANCALDDLFLDIEAEGEIEVRVKHQINERSSDFLHSEVYAFQKGQKKTIDLSHYKKGSEYGVISVELRACHGDARFFGGAFSTQTPAKSDISLAISITTFKREQEVLETAERLQSFLETFPHGASVHVFVVDNGQSAKVQKSRHITPIDNPNFGGAGGFMRGLIEARAKGFTHCLFMDDDATFHLENIRRTFAFLALASDDHTAISGAMISNAKTWAMWEYGAHFDGACKPHYIGADLRKPDVVLDIELATVAKPGPNAYGAWWFFAFPIKYAKHFAFPFFVRGDDVNFSLANDFAIRNLNGIVSFQDDFQEKNSPQTLYYDIRNNLVQGLVIERLARSPLQMSKALALFIFRQIARFHYDTAEAGLLAFSDVLQGPAFFRENLDMSARRADIKALTKTEVWQPVSNPDILHLPTSTNKKSLFAKVVFAGTLNGQFMPFPNKKRELRLPLRERSSLSPIWGASTIHITDKAQKNVYTVRKDRKRAVGLLIQFVKLSWRLQRNIKSIRSSYRSDFDAITSEAFWTSALGLNHEKR